jgi:outer membrane protein
MKKLLQSLFVLGVFGLSVLCARAQTAPKILFVDMSKLAEGHYKWKSGMEALQTDSEKAQAAIDGMNKERDALIAQYNELRDQSHNPTATKEATTKAGDEALSKVQEIRAKTADIAKFQDNAGRELQGRRQELIGGIMSDIDKVAAAVAKSDGATLLVDKSAPSGIGFPVVIYSDPAADITDQVAAEIAKSRPVVTPAAPSATPPPAAEPAPAPSTDQQAPKN